MATKRRNRDTRQVKVSQSLIDGYRKQVDKQGDAAAAYMDGAIAVYVRKYPDASTAQIRKFTYETMQAALPNFTDLAETLSCEFMSHLADKYGWDDVNPVITGSTDYKLVDRKLHYLADLLNEGDLDGFKSSVADVTKFYVKRSAQESMIRNCIDASVRYARVPSGFETCSFCFMLASRGFVYGDEEKAGVTHKFHPNCDCIVVPGAYGRTKIDGYDPQGMYDRWKSCAETVEVNPDANDEATNRHIMREVETRDWHWLYTGEAPKVTYLKPREALEPHEQRAIDNLQKNGFRLTVNDEDPTAPANIDLTSDRNGFLWELKDITAVNSVSSQISRARKKWYKLELGQPKRIVLSIGENADSFNSLVNEAMKRIKNDEEILVVSDSQLIRITK